MGTGDPAVRSQARALLEQFHHPEDGRADHLPLPASRPDWFAWWQKTGSALPAADIWHNFDSHYP